jgi:CBS domain-containing protein
MKVAELMSRDVQIVSADQPISEAARLMAEADTGALPVGSAQQVEGMITDRDIAVRAVAQGRGPETPVREAMTENPVFAYDDQDVDDVAIIMSDRQLRRLPVLSRAGGLVGVISIADLATSDDTSTAEAALTGVVRPGGEHNQSTEEAGA